MGFSTVVARLQTLFEISWRRIWRAAPNPVKMADELLRFLTSVVGVVITAPFEARVDLIISEMQRTGVHNKLIRADDAVRAVFGTQIQMVRQFSLTDEQGLVEWLVSWAAMWIYRTVKSIWLVKSLIRAKTEVEFIEAMLSHFRSKLKLVRLIAGILGAILAFITIAFEISTVAFAFNFGIFKSYLLSQDSKRVRGPRKPRGYQYRLNLGPGPDYAKS